MNTYIDTLFYLKQPTGLVLNAFVGNNARLNSVAQGAMALSVPATTVALNQYDAVYVFDGPSSEVLQVGAGGAIQGATSIPLLNPTAYAHNPGTPYCTDGTSGSLGAQIFKASKYLEDAICFQALWSTTYTGEILTMPTMRASIDNQDNIHFRPRHFPISAFSSLAIQDKRKNLFPLDPTQTTIDSDQQTADIALDALLSNQSQGQGYPWVQTFKRNTTGWLVMTYTAGFAVGALPYPVMEACTLLTSDCFVPLENPIGADQITQGKRTVVFAIRGDLSGESELVKKAKAQVTPYITQAF